MAFAIGTATPVEIGIMRFGAVIIGGIFAGFEAFSKNGATGVIEGCTFGAGTGEI